MSRLPIYLTLSRVLLVIPTAFFFYLDNSWARWVSAIFFIIASVTDYYDGYYARKLNAVTNLGKFFDPVADKILVTSILILLVQKGAVDSWMVILFVARDTIVGGVRAVAAADGIVIDARAAGKWKAGLQMVGIPMLLLNDLHSMIPNNKVGYGLLWLSVLLSLKSGFDYTKAYFDMAVKK